MRLIVTVVICHLSVFKGTSKLNKAQQATENQTIKHIKQGQVC